MSKQPKIESKAQSNDYYNNSVQEITRQYLSLSFEDVHASWINDLQSTLGKANCAILDVGAGSGRDVKYIAEMAAQYSKNNPSAATTPPTIYAVEPAAEMMKVGQHITQQLNVKWLQDSLPALDAVTKLETSFDLILLSAVWMHVAPSYRPRAMRKLANLLKPGGKIVISLKFGMTAIEQSQRSMHDVSVDEIERLAQHLGLITKLETAPQNDALERKEFSWQTVVLQLPDDGTGAFPLIRHVAVNDGKSATHKLALLRVLLRIADGHPGAVLRREACADGDRVILPMGLVALYWIHQYKDLIDYHGLFQTPNKSPNMGFMKKDGWHKLNNKAVDFKVGELFLGNEAIALCKTLSDCAQNIKNMPCKYIKHPNTNVEVFEAVTKTVKPKQSIFLDLDTLMQWGEFSLPETTWLAFSRYACWIEPVLVNEWVKTMAAYKGNAQFSTPQSHSYLYQALSWLEPERNTSQVRKRIDALRKDNIIQCVWSAKPLKKAYDVDHSMPFSRWPNNDLWNLVPSDTKVNNQKRDKLPSQQTLIDSQERMTHWWELAWLNEHDEDSAELQNKRFFAEANIALPGLAHNNHSVNDVFEALCLQRNRLKEMQQLKEWDVI